MSCVTTKPAAKYLTERGRRTSPSYLEKVRGRGPDDPRDRGPDFFRDERGICWYPTEALDRYVALSLAARKFRAPAPQPENFRREKAGA
jgi:hypothetical protein